MSLLKILFSLLVASTLGATGTKPDPALPGACRLVELILTAGTAEDRKTNEPALGDLDCVRANADKNGRLSVDLRIVERNVNGRRIARRLLRPGGTCGNKYVGYRRSSESVDAFVRIDLVRKHAQRFEYRAALRIVGYSKGKTTGVIGVACGAEDSGILTWKSGRWLAVPKLLPASE